MSDCAWQKHRCGVYIPPTRFHSESLKVIYYHHISQPCTKIEALLMIKDKAEAWMENQLPFLYVKAHTARYFHSNGNILHKFYRSRSSWNSYIWYMRIFHVPNYFPFSQFLPLSFLPCSLLLDTRPQFLVKSYHVW